MDQVIRSLSRPKTASRPPARPAPDTTPPQLAGSLISPESRHLPNLYPHWFEKSFHSRSGPGAW
ncbi:hypothetical protein FRUB_08214 [Fimbriiglobus ruber]|uniref:Uncharacterized protein n=1 Tax=Fimbriiglobus ruber TaxID=1908690 RepID=A0A225D245_9BACT|nr:hypothetical protein FRUB_08214 [Fimbriiglobus ruber]